MDPKQKLIAIAVGSVCGLIIVALAVLLVLQIGRMGEAREARDGAESTINGYYAAKPYPSDANRKVREQDETLRTQWADKARAVLTHGLDVPQGESPSQFVQRIGETVRALNARQGSAAPAGQQEQPMDYSFGRYVVQGTMPKDADVSRLAQQFAVIEHVCDQLLDNGAVSITAVTREQFDAAEAKPEEEQTRTRRRRRRTEEAEPAVAAVGAAVDPILAKDGVRRETYSIAFTAPYTAIAKTVNALATDKLFVVVTDLEVSAPVSVAARVDELTKKRQAVKSAAARRASNSRAAAQQQAAAPADETPLFEGASPAERLVTDPAQAVPLTAVLRFDVYTAAPAEAPAAPAETKKGN